jgi:DNA-binding CsgD family transcriptional regulator
MDEKFAKRIAKSLETIRACLEREFLDPSRREGLQDALICLSFLQHFSDTLKKLLENERQEKIKNAQFFAWAAEISVLHLLQKIELKPSAKDEDIKNAALLRAARQNLKDLLKLSGKSEKNRVNILTQEGLTPREIQVAELIRAGHSSLEIAQMLGLSLRTIEFLRGSIRKKVGIKGGARSFREYLLSL